MMTGSVQSLYTQKAKLYQIFFIDLLRWGKVLDTFFQENGYLHPGMKILDAGCGTGIVSKVLYGLARRKGFEDILFHGFDLTRAMLDLFRQWMLIEGVQDIQLREANVLDLENQLPEEWKDYDLIISSTMFEYIPKEKLGQAIGNLRGLLKHEGCLLVFVTRRTWITRWTAAKWWRTNLFDWEELEAELRQAGFTTIQKKTLPGTWDSFILVIEAATAP